MIKRIGELDTRIDIQERTETVDAHGGITKAWQSIGTMWSKVETTDGQGKESAEGNFKAASEDFKFTVRYQKSIAFTPTARILWKNGFFDIISILTLPEGRPDIVEIKARRTSQGIIWTGGILRHLAGIYRTPTQGRYRT